MRAAELLLFLLTPLLGCEAGATDCEVVTSTIQTTLHTCTCETQTLASAAPGSLAASVIVSIATATATVTEKATETQMLTVTTCPPRTKRTVLMTKTICERCIGSVTFTTAPASLASIYSEAWAPLKACVRCDNRPNCTEPIRPSDPADTPPCRFCCSAPANK